MDDFGISDGFLPDFLANDVKYLRAIFGTWFEEATDNQEPKNSGCADLFHDIQIPGGD